MNHNVNPEQLILGDTSDLQAVAAAIQRNCDIADAKYAGEDTLCIYLLRLRDYYYWVEDVPLGATLDRELLGDWISGIEQRWDELEDLPFSDLQIADQSFNCFDNRSINDLLNPLGYVYSGGHGRGGRPMFFLGELEAFDRAGIQRVLIAGKELARCVAAPPAMSLGDTITVRRDALRRYLYSMVEEQSMRREGNAMSWVVAHYDFDQDPQGAMDALVEHELENLILHEIGEQVAGELIDGPWGELISQLDNPLDEHRARAVRDNLADCATTLPGLLSLQDTASLDFYYANMTPLRRDMFPSFCDAWREARSGGDWGKLATVVRQGRAHWLRTGRDLVRQIGAANRQQLHTSLNNCAF